MTRAAAGKHTGFPAPALPVVPGAMVVSGVALGSAGVSFGACAPSGHVRCVTLAGILSLSPGCDRSVLRRGWPPRANAQQGSPSSAPLLTPSPSESLLQNSTVYLKSAARKSAPNWFTVFLPVLQFAWPRFGHRSPSAGPALGLGSNWRKRGTAAAVATNSRNTSALRDIVCVVGGGVRGGRSRGC